MVALASEPPVSETFRRLSRLLWSAALVAAALLIALIGLVAPSPQQAAAAPATTPKLSGDPIFTDPWTWAAWAMSTYTSSAPSLSVIADTPQSRWFGDWNPTSTVAGQINDYVGRANAVGQMPVLTLYAIPHRDCGGYSAGGLPDAKAYAAWIAQVRRGIAKRSAAIVLEPDALAAANCLSTSQKTARYATLKAAVYALSSDPATVVYIDAGHSHWHLPTTIAARLKAVGVSRARGFSLNVANFNSTSSQLRYGEQVSKLVGGKHYVIDTSRNGLGPATGKLNWCNPAGRALGVKPTLKTGAAHADAYLWIKHPGESDGSCGRKDPQSGSWFNSYALGLIARSTYHR